jgi:hypothetical protein
VQGRHIEQNTAGDDRRERIGAGDVPVLAAQVLVGVEPVPDPAVVAEVVQRVDVRSALSPRCARRS